MKVKTEIDTDNKKIKVFGEVRISELIHFLKTIDKESWTLYKVSFEVDELPVSLPGVPYIPNIPVGPYPDVIGPWYNPHTIT